MKNIYTFLMALISFSAVSAQSWTKPEHAKKYNGKIINVVGHVSKIEQQRIGNNTAICFRLIGADSTQFLNLVILNSQQQAGKEGPEVTFLHKYVHVKGKIRTYKGNPQITLSSFKEIAIANESEMDRYRFEPE
jgi:DNA/RNA endonuclease YhcR with UshA esterase domain